MLTHRLTGRTFTYGDMAVKASKVSVIDEPHIKKPSEFSTMIGKRVRLLDCEIKVYGQATSGIDVTLPNMLYAAVSLCPVFGGTLKRYNFDAIRGRKGVISAVELNPDGNDPQGVAVLADSWWRAKTALDAMPIEWNDGPNAKDSSKEYFARFHAEMEKPGNVVFDEGDVPAALKSPGRTIEAVYEYPHQTVLQMEPPACTALVSADRVDVWGSDGTANSVRAAAKLANLPVEKSFFHHTFAGGSFGGAGSARPPLSHAVQVARTVPGRPVKVVVHREQDLQKGAYRPMGVARAVGKVGADGMPIAISFRCVTSSHNRPAVPIGRQEVRMEAHSAWGFASIPYAAPNVRSEVTEMRTAIPIATWRAPGHNTAAFIIETFIDELAHAGGKDPYQFRRQLIAANKGHDPSFRHKAAWIRALDIVAKASGWGSRLPPGSGRGIGIDDRRKHTHPEVQAVYTDSSLVTIAATVAEVTVSREGRVTLNKIFISHDSGVENGIINPEAVEKQILGQIAWAMSAGLIQELTVEGGRIVQSNFHNYPAIRMADFPLHVEIHEFTKGEWIAGAGEEAIPSIVPAICNAIFVATGKRIRTLPVTKHDLSWS